MNCHIYKNSTRRRPLLPGSRQCRRCRCTPCSNDILEQESFLPDLFEDMSDLHLKSLTPPQALAAGRQALPQVEACTMHETPLGDKFPFAVSCRLSNYCKLTPPQVLAAGQQAVPPVEVYTLHTPSPLQHTAVRPGPQLLAYGQHALPLHATLPGHVCIQIPVCIKVTNW